MAVWYYYHPLAGKKLKTTDEVTHLRENISLNISHRLKIAHSKELNIFLNRESSNEDKLHTKFYSD